MGGFLCHLQEDIEQICNYDYLDNVSAIDSCIMSKIVSVGITTIIEPVRLCVDHSRGSAICGFWLVSADGTEYYVQIYKDEAVLGRIYELIKDKPLPETHMTTSIYDIGADTEYVIDADAHIKKLDGGRHLENIAHRVCPIENIRDGISSYLVDDQECEYSLDLVIVAKAGHRSLSVSENLRCAIERCEIILRPNFDIEIYNVDEPYAKLIYGDDTPKFSLFHFNTELFELNTSYVEKRDKLLKILETL